MSKESKDSKTNTPQPGNTALPKWVWVTGAVLLGGLMYTSVQMNQAQDQLEQASAASVDAKKAMTMAEGAQAETMKKTDTLMKEAGMLKEEAAAHKKMAATLEEKITGLNGDLAASKTRAGALQDELKSASGKLSMAMAENEKGKLVAKAKEKLTQQLKTSQEMQASSMKEAATLKNAAAGFKEKIGSLEKELTASKARLGALQEEVKAASGKLSMAMAESEKHKQAAEAQEKLALEYKEKAERAAAQ